MRIKTDTPASHRSPTDIAPSRPTLALQRDKRGVSEVLGAILMFGLLMTLLVLIQVNAVPAQNQQIEFEHSQRAQQDMLSLDRALLQAGTENVPASTQVELAAQYPSRFFLINPSVGTGSIETLAPGTVTVSNAVAPSASTYWNGDRQTFDTRVLRYRPNYNEYRNAPVTSYEHNTLVNTFDNDAVRPVGSGSFLAGDQIVLVLVDGQLSTSSTSAKAIETMPLSAPARTVTVTNGTNSGITLSLPTTLTEAHWETLLEDEDNIAELDVTSGSPYNTLTVTLEPGSYQLRMARVGVGSDINESALGPHYLTAVGDAYTESIRTSESQELRVRVRDQFNNPTTGDVTFTSTDGSFRQSDGGTVDSLTKPSSESGDVSAVFVPSAGFTGTAEVTASQDFNGDGTTQGREQVAFTVPVQADSGSNMTNSASNVNPYFGESIRLESISRQPNNSVTLEFYNNGSSDREMQQIRLLFYSSGSGKVAEWGKLNDDARDQFYRIGGSERIDQSIVIESQKSKTVGITFDRANPRDLFGITIEYNGLSSTYFVQIP